LTVMLITFSAGAVPAFFKETPTTTQQSLVLIVLHLTSISFGYCYAIVFKRLIYWEAVIDGANESRKNGEPQGKPLQPPPS
jgi:hypothetical protein